MWFKFVVLLVIAGGSVGSQVRVWRSHSNSGWVTCILCPKDQYRGGLLLCLSYSTSTKHEYVNLSCYGEVSPSTAIHDMYPGKHETRLSCESDILCTGLWLSILHHFELNRNCMPKLTKASPAIVVVSPYPMATDWWSTPRCNLCRLTFPCILLAYFALWPSYDMVILNHTGIAYSSPR